MLEYTPQQTSRELIRAASLVNPKTVVDFCAGNGSLLQAAKEHWPTARCFANDIDGTVLRAVPDVVWVTSDFLSSDFELISLLDFPESFDLIVLNPPFSFERNQCSRARGKFSEVNCSIAFAFLFTALGYLSEEGELLAVMPTSTLRSDRDANARKYLRKYFKCRMISQPNYDRFPGLDVSTYLMAVRHKRSLSEPSNPCEIISQAGTGWTISRGNISVKRSNRVQQVGLHGWIHTTSIKSSRIAVRYELPDHCLVKNQKFLPKNSLIIPRVGKIRPGDLVLSKRKEILSDCLIGVTFDHPSFPARVLCNINENFSSFMKIYSGTGAPYTTQLKVSQFINNLLAKHEALTENFPEI